MGGDNPAGGPATVREAASGRFDFIIVGAGTAGCLLANRLSADPRNRVLILEAGGNDNWIWFHIPVGYLFAIGNPRSDWMFRTEPEAGLNGRSLAYPRGKVIGGSSAINAMISMRGQAADYDHWRQLGLAGWGYDDVLPYFKWSENHWGAADRYHARGGPLSITKHVPDARLFPRFIEAVNKLGYKTQVDHHGPEQEGWGSPDISIHKGWRGSTAARFLVPAMQRPNLTVIAGALATKLEVQSGRAVALHYRQGGQDHRLEAGREIVLSGGAYNSPQLLLLSGIGLADELRDLGIEVVHDLAGVGRNLQDHPSIAMVWANS